MRLSKSGAKFSADMVYRHLLWRIWDKNLPLFMALMLNPSKAGKIESDPTVTRQIERAKRFGCGGLIIANTHDLVSTDPRALKVHPRPISQDCDKYILLAATLTQASKGYIICAWGKNCPSIRQKSIMDMLAPFPTYCLGRNGDGSPEHPLYKPYNSPLLEYA